MKTPNLVLIGLVGSTLLAGCASAADVAETSEPEAIGSTSEAITLTTEQQAIDAVLADPDIIVDTSQPFSTDHVSTDYSTKWSGQKYVLCQDDKYSAKASAQQIIALDPNVGVLYPGALVHGIDANSGTLTPILLPRSGGSVALDDSVFVTGATATKSSAITQFRPDVVSDAISGILQSNPVNTASRASLVIEEAKSFEQAMLKIGVDVNKAKFSLHGDFVSTSWAEKTNLVVKFTQIYYTAYPVLPYPAQVFASDVTASDVSKVTSPADPILYVSGVSYGRTLLMRVESDSSAADLKAALNVAYQGTVNAAVQLSAAQQQMLSNSRLEVFTLGGGSDVGVKILAGPSELQNYLKAGATWSPSSPGMPISYTLRALKSGKAFAAKYTSDFTIPSCSAGKDKEVVGFKLNNIDFSDSGDAAGKGDLQWSFDFGPENAATQNFSSSGRTKVGDGETKNLSWTPADLELLRDQRFLLKVKVWDQNCHIKWNGSCNWKDDDLVDSQVYFHYDKETSSWVSETPGEFSSGHLSFKLNWTIERKNPCASFETWDKTKDLCIPPGVNPTNAGQRVALGMVTPNRTEMTATASSTYSGYSPLRVIDGDTSTALGGAYSWANANMSTPQWVQLDLGGTRAVQDVDVYTTASYPLADYELEVYNGSRWLPFASMRGNTAAKVSHHVTTPVQGSAFRILALRGPQQQPTYVRVNELAIK
jgi:thiol-activated cytolysin